MVDKILAKDEIREVYEFVQSKYSALERDDLAEVLGILNIIAPLNPDKETVSAVLLLRLFLDGVLEDEQVKKHFGLKVLEILVGVRKLRGLKYEENDKKATREIFRRMFMAMAKDLRVVLVEISAKLWQLKNVKDLKDDRLFAKEILDVYAPVAARLGIYNLKNQLEDLAFKVMDYDSYTAVTQQLERFGKTNRHVIKAIEDDLRKFLRSEGVEAEVSGRIKGVYSIYKKMGRKGLSAIDELYDIFAIRVILPAKFNELGDEQVDHLYSVLGMIHKKWKPLASRFKDYIAVPKPNGYRSLHTVVLGLAPRSMGRPVEVQIRSSEMHREAEYGVSAHWLYKEKGKSEVDPGRQVNWIKEMQEFQDDVIEGEDAFQSMDLDVFHDRIFVITPRGEVKDLISGATPVDFAYSVHSTLGEQCVMAKVNGSVVPLSYELKNGDVVEIVRKKDSKPKLQWMSFVKSSNAKAKIKAYFSAQDRDANIRKGKRILNEALEKMGKETLDQNYSILKSFGGREYAVGERELMLQEIGKGSQSANDLLRKVFPTERGMRVVQSEPRKKAPRRHKLNEQVQRKMEEMILVGGESGLPVKLASCCKPKSGQEIRGYITRGNSITVHRSKCQILKGLELDRQVDCEWDLL